MLGLMGLCRWEDAARGCSLGQVLLLLIRERMLNGAAADELRVLSECHLFVLLWKSFQTLLLM